MGPLSHSEEFAHSSFSSVSSPWHPCQTSSPNPGGSCSVTLEEGTLQHWCCLLLFLLVAGAGDTIVMLYASVTLPKQCWVALAHGISLELPNTAWIWTNNWTRDSTRGRNVGDETATEVHNSLSMHSLFPLLPITEAQLSSLKAMGVLRLPSGEGREAEPKVTTIWL